MDKCDVFYLYGTNDFQYSPNDEMSGDMVLHRLNVVVVVFVVLPFSILTFIFHVLINAH